MIVSSKDKHIDIRDQYPTEEPKARRLRYMQGDRLTEILLHKPRKKGKYMKFTIGKTYTTAKDNLVVYRGIFKDFGYSCDICGKERQNVHWFDTDNSNYPVGTECAKKFIKLTS